MVMLHVRAKDAEDCTELLRGPVGLANAKKMGSAMSETSTKLRRIPTGSTRLCYLYDRQRGATRHL